MKRLIALAIAPAAVAVFAAGCGGGGSSGSAGSGYGGAAKPAASSARAAVAVRTTQLGPTLVDRTGRTLHLFEKDKTMASTCDGACASVWPPLTTNGKPQAQAGTSAAKLGRPSARTARSRSRTPAPALLLRLGHQAGQLSGEGLDQFGATWDALAPSGEGIDGN